MERLLRRPPLERAQALDGSAARKEATCAIRPYVELGFTLSSSLPTAPALIMTQFPEAVRERRPDPAATEVEVRVSMLRRPDRSYPPLSTPRSGEGMGRGSGRRGRTAMCGCVAPKIVSKARSGRYVSWQQKFLGRAQVP